MAERVHDFGPKLKAKRKLLGLSQSDVATQLGNEMECDIAPSTVSNYESGYRFYTPEQAAVMCRLYRMPYEELGGPKALRVRERIEATRQRRGRK